MLFCLSIANYSFPSSKLPILMLLRSQFIFISCVFFSILLLSLFFFPDIVLFCCFKDFMCIKSLRLLAAVI